MSLLVMARIWDEANYDQSDDPELTVRGSDLLVHLRIGDRASDEGYAFPGYDELARKARLRSHRAVRQAIEKLKRTGHVVVLVEAHGQGYSNLFQVLTGTPGREVARDLYAVIDQTHEDSNPTAAVAAEAAYDAFVARLRAAGIQWLETTGFTHILTPAAQQTLLSGSTKPRTRNRHVSSGSSNRTKNGKNSSGSDAAQKGNDSSGSDAENGNDSSGFPDLNRNVSSDQNRNVSSDHKEEPSVSEPPLTDSPNGESGDQPSTIEQPGTAQTILADYLDWKRLQLGDPDYRGEQRTIGQLAGELKKLVDQDIPVAFIKQGLADWDGRSMHPSTLPSFVDAVCRTGNGRYGRPTTTNGKASVLAAVQDSMAELEGGR